jgi:transposase
MYIGMDVHKKVTVVKGVDEEGKVVRREKFLTTVEELDSFVESLSENDEIVLEASTSGFFAYEQLEEHNVNVKMAHPQQVRAIAAAKIKTDDISAETLAQLLRMDFIPEAHVPPKEKRELRVLVRHRVSLVGMRTRVKNKIHALLAQEGVKSPLQDLFGVGGLKFLETVELKPARQHALQQLLSLLSKLNQLIEETAEEMKEKAESMPEVKLLCTIPCIGTYGALAILAEIGDVQRFPDPKPLISYAGLHPRVMQSGNTTRYGHISRQSNSLLRWILVQAAHVAVRTPNRFQKIYYTLLARKPNQIAITATARKLLESTYWVLTKQEEYKDHAGTASPELFMGSARTEKMMGAA